MKKFLLLGTVALFSLSAMAQTRSTAPLPAHRNIKSLKAEKLSGMDTRVTESRWLNYALDLEANLGMTMEFNFMPLFPDSTIILGFDDTGAPFSAWTHMAATLIEPYDMPSGWLVPGNNYQLDSTAIWYAYTRNTDASVVDTLVLTFIKTEDLVLYPFELTSGETFNYYDILYDYANNRVQPSLVQSTITYALTEADSSSSTNELFFSTPQANLEGKPIAVVVSFKPGYTWVPFVGGNPSADSLFGKNAFFLGTFEESLGGTPTDYNAWEANMSYVITSQARYGMFTATQGWNGYFLPSPMFVGGYAFEHHAIFFKVTSDEVSVNEVENNFARIAAFPNPAADGFTLAADLKQASSNVSVVITDVLGREVSVIEGGARAAGIFNVAVNTSFLANGVYNCSVKSGNQSVTTKVVVSH